MKQALFQEAKGARIRCRRCGERIEVWNPAAPAVSAATEAEPEIVPAAAPEPVAEAPLEPIAESHPAPEVAAEAPPEPITEAGIELEPITAREIEPVAEPAPEPVAEAELELVAETELGFLSELEPGPVVAAYAPVEVEPPVEAQPTVPAFDLVDAVPYVAPESGFSREERGADLAALKQRFRNSRRRGPSRFAIFLAVSAILLVAGVAFLFRDTQSARNLLHNLFPPSAPGNAARAVPPADAEGEPAYEIRDLESFHVDAFGGGKLFVIQGTVANVGKGPSRGILLRATLLGVDNQALVDNVVFAGNRVDNTTLRHADREVIRKILTVRYGAGNANRDIPAGSSLPFMAVFFDPPAQFESFAVKAADAE
jgi:hypothetical protein